MNINDLKFKELVPPECPELYWELRKLGARPYQANWKSIAIHNFNGEELSIGSIYTEMRNIGIPPVEALKIEIAYWKLYDEEDIISSWEAGLLLHIENGDNVDYVSSLLLN